MKKQVQKKGISIVQKVSILAGSIAAIASFIVGSLIVSGSEDIVYQNALNRLKHETNIKSLNLVSDIKGLSSDAQYLVGTPPILGIPRAINNGGIDPFDDSHLSKWQSRLTMIFSELIRAKPDYLQIRYIGIADNGKELIRVDRRGNNIRVTPETELQEKGDTAYFKNAIKLHSGEVYLSDITLNREFGQVSEPYTPMIRAATPVYFEEKLFGILVINMSFDAIFNNLIENTPKELIPYVINEQGYFLAHPVRAMTYGFDLGNEITIKDVYPDFDLDMNDDLRVHEYTQVINGDVVQVVKTHYDPELHDRYFLVILATSHDNLQSGAKQLRQQSFIIMGLLVTISLVATAVLATRLMRPMRLISKAAEDIACGREVSNLPVDSRDEIGELARSFDDMQHQLEDKERELLISQGHVHHANKMAALGEMAAGMGHEINSPIQAICFIAQRVQRQLEKDISKDEINAAMEKINNNVKKISDIINSLSKVSRYSTDDDFVDTRIGDLIADTINMTEERFKLNNVKLEVNYHEVSENLIIQCQRLQINQVLINLVNNAYDAIRESDGKWIKVDIRRRANFLQIAITDSGLGIPEELVDRIFEPMFTTKDIGKGTGLGLSISNDIVSKHNGQLYVDKSAKHTRFVIDLPIVHIEK
ncbi:MAG: ATP-binding protein [Gammaproteobacteria bacterium]|nr:ATP-binding protein [Gammaproteobacteria bacterium]